MPEHLTYYHLGQTPIDLTIHRANKTSIKKKPTIFYIHGGGIIYGSRCDLPKEYIKLLTDNGSDLVMLDYPLLPEATLDIVFDTLKKGVEFGLNYLDQDREPYLLFGRSAGAYLALVLSSKYLKSKPCGIISFYGYFDLSHPTLKNPSPYYNQYGLLPNVLVQGFIGKDILSSAQIQSRFPIYLSYRQQGTWVKQLLSPDLDIEDYSLNQQELADLPSLFIAASDADQDVDVTISKDLHTKASSSTLKIVHDLSHDFDQNPKETQAVQVYDDLKNWINDR